MGNSEIFRQVREAVSDGQDRRQVYEGYKDRFQKPLKLAMVIANIPYAGFQVTMAP